MCDFSGPPYQFKLGTWVPTQEELSWKPGRAYEYIVASTVFENVPFNGNLSYTQMDQDGPHETGLYYVCCTGSHYQYYDALVEKWFHIERLDEGDPDQAFHFPGCTVVSG